MRKEGEGDGRWIGRRGEVDREQGGRSIGKGGERDGMEMSGEGGVGRGKWREVREGKGRLIFSGPPKRTKLFRPRTGRHLVI